MQHEHILCSGILGATKKSPKPWEAPNSLATEASVFVFYRILQHRSGEQSAERHVPSVRYFLK